MIKDDFGYHFFPFKIFYFKFCNDIKNSVGFGITITPKRKIRWDAHLSLFKYRFYIRQRVESDAFRWKNSEKTLGDSSELL